MAPSHEEVLEATRERADAMRGLVADICSRIPISDFPDTAVSALFKDGRTPAPSAAAAAAAQAPAVSPLVAAALAGGCVGAVVAAAVTLLLLQRSQR